MVPDSFVVIVTNKSCVFDSWLGGDYGLSFNVIVIGLFEWRVFCSCFKWPFRVGREGGSCLEIRLVVRPVHVIKLQLLIA